MNTIDSALLSKETLKQEMLNIERKNKFKTKLDCIKAGVCPTCGTPLKIIKTKIRITKLVWLSIIVTGIYLAFTNYLFVGILSMIIGIPACPKGCTIKRLHNYNIAEKEYIAYCNCINVELRNFYKHRLRDRHGWGRDF